MAEWSRHGLPWYEVVRLEIRLGCERTSPMDFEPSAFGGTLSSRDSLYGKR